MCFHEDDIEGVEGDEQDDEEDDDDEEDEALMETDVVVEDHPASPDAAKDL